MLKHPLIEVGDVETRPGIRTSLHLLLPLALPPLPICSFLCSFLCCRRSQFAPSFAPPCAAAAPILLPLALPPLPLLRVACLLDSRGDVLPSISRCKQHDGNGSSYSTWRCGMVGSIWCIRDRVGAVREVVGPASNEKWAVILWLRRRCWRDVCLRR
jgi:hypothetical protein